MKYASIMLLATVIAAAAIATPSLDRAASGMQDDWVQQWKIYPSRDNTADNVNFGIERSRVGNHWSSNHDVPFSRFQGLARDTLARGGSVKFEYVHDAGRMTCLGSVANGGGAGTFTFVENPQFSAELRRLGYEAPDADRIFDLLAMDISLDFARGIRAQFPSATLKQLTEMRIHGVSLAYISDIHQAGYRDLSIADFVEMRIHGVSVDFIRDLKAAGYNVSAKKVVDMRIHGVSTEYLRELKTYGLQPDADQIVELRIHSVSPDYLKGLRDAGYSGLESRQVVEMRIHGVGTDFIQETKALGFNFTTKELVELRIHGVTGAYLRKLKDSGFKNLSADQIARLRIHGVD